jgi:hypothetical protein
MVSGHVPVDEYCWNDENNGIKRPAFKKSLFFGKDRHKPKKDSWDRHVAERGDLVKQFCLIF